MTDILTRAQAGRALTFAELDANFTNLNAGKAESSTVTSLTAQVGSVAANVADLMASVNQLENDSISVSLYGLHGDSTTGNSAAMLAMFATLSGPTELLFPKGDYLLDTSITIPENIALRLRAGARFLIPNGVTLTLAQPELLAGLQQVFYCTGTGKVIGTVKNALIFPEWWGAKADGLWAPVGTDFSQRAAAAARNGAAIQAALNFAGYSYPINGLTGTVSLAYGYYVYAPTLSVPLSVNVIGYGIGSGVFYYGKNGNGIESINTNNTMLKDFFIAPIAGPDWNTSDGYGLYMKGVSTPIVDNVWSSSFGGASAGGGGTFYFESVIEGRLRGLISDNARGPAFTIRGVGRGTVLENAVTANSQYGACFDIAGYDWHLMGCTAKDGLGGSYGYYLGVCENINMTNCGAHQSAKEAFYVTSSALSCNLVSCFANDASTITGGSGVYAAFNVSGNRIKLTAPKVTSSQGAGVTYSYPLILGGAAIDCTVTDENFTDGTLGGVLDAQPTGANTWKVRKKTTTDATVTTLWTKNLNNSAACTIEGFVNMKQRGSTGESASFRFRARAVTGSGGTTISTASIYTDKSNGSSTVNATFNLTNSAANAGVVSLQVTGLATGNPIDWEATVTCVSVTG